MNGADPKKKKQKGRKDYLYKLANHIDGFTLDAWPEFERDFKVKEDERGVLSYVEIMAGKICRYVSEDAVVNEIIRFTSKNLTALKDGVVTHAEATACFRQWRGIAPVFDEEIVPVAQKSEDVLCWRKLDFDFCEGPTPAFDELFSRIENCEALMAWIGSLFVHDSDRQQYVWIYGSGMNGKGELSRFLRWVFGKTYSSQQPPTMSDRFWVSGLLGARVVVFPDCNDYTFPTSGLLKSITGGDAQKIEEKGRNCYTADLFCKMLFLSNKKPNITGGAADTRRIIYCEIDAINHETMASAEYARMLEVEAPAFLHKCYTKYQEVAPANGAIPVDKDGIIDLVEENAEQWSVLFDKHFIEDKRGDAFAKHMHPHVSPSEMQRVLEGLNFKDKRQFQGYLATKGFGRERVRLPNGDRVYKYLGIRLKNLVEQDEDKTEKERY